MLSIYICEDDAVQMIQIDKIITDQIIYKNLDMNIELVTQNPNDIINHLKKRNNLEYGVYFLDVELNSDINGIELGSMIREYDPRAYIVYITVHPELLALTFEHKVEALDYISKDDKDIKNRVIQCLKNINNKHRKDIRAKSKGIFVKTDEKSLGVSFNDILFIETSTTPHRIIMYTYNQRIEFYGTISEIYDQLDDRFIHAHRSRILNVDKVTIVDKKSRMVTLDNGQTTYISMRALNNVLSNMKHINIKN